MSTKWKSAGSKTRLNHIDCHYVVKKLQYFFSCVPPKEKNSYRVRTTWGWAMMTALSFGYTIPLNKLKDEIQICTVCWTYAIKTICSDFFFFFLALYKIPKVLCNIEWNTRVEQIQATRDIKHFLCVCLWQWRDIHSEDDFDLRGS